MIHVILHVRLFTCGVYNLLFLGIQREQRVHMGTSQESPGGVSGQEELGRDREESDGCTWEARLAAEEDSLQDFRSLT